MLSITLFVDGDANPGGDGLAWGTAYHDLQTALTSAATLNADADTANDVEAIWIAEGTYQPSVELESGDVRSASFSLLDGVTLYGGFAGTETLLDSRDLSSHQTILSGDLGVLEDNSDNAYTVIYCGANIEAAVDGVWVTDGNANGSIVGYQHSLRDSGGGIYNSGSLTITNSTISNNAATLGGGAYNSNATEDVSASLTVIDSTFTNNSANHGGGIYNFGTNGSATVVLVGSTFTGNIANGSGGGIGNSSLSGAASLTVTNSLFVGNAVGSRGGGIVNYGYKGQATLDLTNSTIAANQAATSGGGIYSYGDSAVTLHNTIIAENVAAEEVDLYCKPATLTGSYNLIGDGEGQDLVHEVDGNQIGTTSEPLDPLFVLAPSDGGDGWGDDLTTDDIDESLNDDYGDLQLQLESPAMNAGSNALALDPWGQPLTVDVLGNKRFFEVTVDIGAIEYHTPPGVIYIVTSLENTIANDGVLTFLEAFQAANTNAAVGDAPAGETDLQDVIRFAEGLSGTVSVNGGELLIQDDLMIEGPETASLIFDAGGQNRVFTIEPDVSVYLSDIIITGGSASEGGGIYNQGNLSVVSSLLTENDATQKGGGIYNLGTLEILDSTLSSNTSDVTNDNHGGGAIYNEGDLTINGSTLAGNEANYTDTNSNLYYTGGGAIYNNAGSLTLTDSVLSENSSERNGGAIYNHLGTVVIDGSTISENTAQCDGGGIDNTVTSESGVASLTITNSTIAHNIAADRGGGLYHRALVGNATIVITNTTLFGNTAGSKGGGIYGLSSNDATTITITNATIAANVTIEADAFGGGICLEGDFSSAILNNTIVAANTSATGTDVYLQESELTGANNLIGDGSEQTLVDGTDGNQVGTSSEPLDPMLSQWTQLEDGTWGYYLLPDSPAIDAGDDALALDPEGELLELDRYGNARVSGDFIDIGAVEGATQETSSVTYLVTSLENTIAKDGELTFIEAFQAANCNQAIGDAPAGSFAQQDIIQFAEDLTGTILLDGNELVIIGSLSIEGDDSEGIMFDAAGQSRVFLVQPNADANFSGITITGGSEEDGGAIYNRGSLAIDDATIKENSVSNLGGGIYNEGTLTLTNVTLSDNAASSGGGIANEGSMTILRSTLSDNSAEAKGGGIYTEGSMSLTYSTISGNTSAAHGGGIYSDSFSESITLTVTGSMFVNNTASNHGGAIYNRSAGPTMNSTMFLINSILIGNTADLNGGGVYNDGAAGGVTLTLTNSTLSENTASDKGGAIYNRGDYAAVTLNNTIAANNTTASNGSDIYSTSPNELTGSYNLIGDGTGLAGWVNGTDGNLVGTSASPIDPMLGQWIQLANGRWAYSLSTDSPAIDAGNNSLALDASSDTLRYDAAGNPRVENDIVDIGACEGSLIYVDAGGPYEVDEGSSVELTVSATSATGGEIVSYEWDLNGDGLFDDATGETATFDSDQSGDFTVSVQVTDSTGIVGVTIVSITVNNVAPTADAGGPYSGTEGETITLDASGSTDPGNDIVSYVWDLDNDGQYDDAFGVVVNYSSPGDGSHTVNLKVTDSDGAISTDSITITVSNAAPTANAGGPYSVDEGATVTLDASGSTDPGGDIVSYEWDLDNDGEYDDATGETVDFSYLIQGDQIISVKVTDDDGDWDIDSTTVTVNGIAPEASFDTNINTGTDDVIFSVIYSDNTSISTATIGTGDILVTGPNGYSQYATLLSVDNSANGSPRVATYRITSPDVQWIEDDNGIYQVTMVANQVSDLGGSFVAAGIIGSFTISALNLTPIADVGGPYSGDEGETITLDASASTDPDGSVVSYAWDLDNDGQYDDATGATLDFMPVASGSYTVSVQVTDDDDATNVDSVVVTVNNLAPTADAGGPYTSSEGETFTLDASGSSDPGNDIVSYAWDLDGDGEFDDGVGTTVDFTSTGSGSYTVSVQVTDDDGAVSVDSAEVTVVNVAPTADAGGAYTGTEGETFTLDASGSTDPGNDIASYAWDLDGDGQYDDGTGVTVDLTPTSSGTYTVSVQVTDADGAVSTDDVEVIVANVEPTADAGGPYTGIEGGVFTLDASGSTDPGNDIASYVWDLDGDGQYDDATGVTVDFTPTSSGIYTVSVKVTDADGAVSTNDAEVTVTNVAPTADAGGPYTGTEGDTFTLDASSSTDPGNDIASYAWDLDGDGQYDDGTGVTVDFTPASSGTYTVSLKVTDEDGAVSTDDAEVTVTNVEPTANAGGPYAGSEGGTFTLNASGSIDAGNDIVSYAWDLDGDGLYDDGSGVTIDFAPMGSGTYTVSVKVTDDNGAMSTDDAKVVVDNATPTADVGGPYTGTEGDTFTLDASGSTDPGNDIASYAWDLDGDGQYDDGTGVTVDFAPASSGTYTVSVKVTDEDGAVSTDDAQVTIDNVVPVADAGGPYVGSEGDTFTLDASASIDPGNDISSYAWDLDGDGQYDDGTGVTVDFTPTSSGNHTVSVQVTDEDGAVSTDEVEVTVANAVPVADAGGPYSGTEGDIITLNASGSTDLGNDIVSYAWDFDGDGQYDDATGAVVHYHALASGTFTVTVKVTDDDGASDTSSVQVVIAPLPVQDWGTVRLNLRNWADTKDIAWLDEWSGCWIEVWATGTETIAIDTFDVELAFEADYFTPELAMDQAGASVDAGTLSVTQNEATGNLQITGTTNSANVGQGSEVLLAKIAFKPTPGESVLPRDTDGKYLEPVADAGFQLVQAELTQSDSPTVSNATIASPDATPLWPVMYDLNGDSTIDLLDVAQMLAVFQWNTDENATPMTWASDFDRSGTVDLLDVAQMLARFQYRKGDGNSVTYPADFPFEEPESPAAASVASLASTDVAMAESSWNEVDSMSIAKELTFVSTKKSTAASDKVFELELDFYDNLS